MAVAIKAGQWGRSKAFGWTLCPFIEFTDKSELWAMVVHLELHEPTVESFEPNGSYFDDHEPSDNDIIEVSDTDPRAVQAEAVQAIMVPVDLQCIPEGYRAVRVGVPQSGETYLANLDKCFTGVANDDRVRLIVEPIAPPKPKLQLVEGAWTRLRNGTIVGPIQRHADGPRWPWMIAGAMYPDNGMVSEQGRENPLDVVELVRIVTAPWEGGAQ